MTRLLAVSLIWALSFGLLKHQLAGVHPDIVNAVRMGLSLLVFAPWLLRRGTSAKLAFVGVGALQFGLMYTSYTRSFAYLAGHQVALATILTPLYVTLFDDLLERRIRWRFLAAALLSVVGTALAVGAGRLEGAWTGLLLLQLSNLCFAIGQIWYRRIQSRRGSSGPGSDATGMAWAYLGGVLVTGLAAAPQLSQVPAITAGAWLTLGWLGVVASGVCFFLWNSGARAVNTGVLAVMNDLKIPLGVLVSLVVFGEQADVPRLLAGCVLVAVAWWIAWRDRGEARQLAEARP